MAQEDSKSVVKVEIDKGVAWVTLNRPDKRNAMSPALNNDMVDVLNTLEAEEMLSVKLTTAQRAGDLRNLQAVFEHWKKEWARLQPQVREMRWAWPTPPRGTKA